MAKRISFSAISLAISLICLYGAAALNVGKIAALAVSALFCAAVVSMYGVRYGLCVYLGTSILALLLIPNKLFVFIYILFVGYYPIVKLYIESIKKLWLEWILKVLFFNLALFLIYWFATTFFAPALESVLASIVLHYISLLVVGLEVIFIVFDCMLSYMLSYYHEFLRRITHE